MPHDRSAARASAVTERRPAAPIQRSAIAAASPAAMLRHRLGHQGTQALVQRKAAQDAVTKATRVANVSSPHDAAELEAESTARNVVRMPQPVFVPVPVPVPAAGAAHPIQRAAAPLAPTIAPAAMPGAGVGLPLAPSVRDHMEPRFGANFGGVRVHTDDAAAEQSAQLGAHAFTVGHHVFFGRDKYQPDSAGGRELIAHELTHTIQQGATPQAAPAVQRAADRGVVQRSADTTVTQRTAPRIQRFGFDDAMNWIADKANAIPGFRMLTLVLGVNPVNMAPVERSGANVLRAILELVPITGPLVEAALDNYGILNKVGAWMDVKVRSLGLVGAAIWQAVKDFASSLGISDIWSPGKTWDRAVGIFKGPIDRLIALGTSTISEILGFIREAILMPLAALAEGTKGYDLLKAVLGQDPVTGKPVPRTPDTLIGGFMKLIGEEEIWENVKKANAVPRAWAWFQGALEGVMVFVRAVPKVFMDTLKSLEITDLLLPPKAFVKVAIAFGSFLGQFLSWAGNAMWTLLQLIFEVVSPATLTYLKKTGAALKSIIKNPIPFMHHLLDAAKLGLQNFADNFGAHLKAALFDWLLGALPGVYIPQAFTLQEIVKFIFSVLGLSWANIRQKLVAVVGETAVKAMETGFDIVVTLVTKGPAAAWDKIKDELSNLKDQVISGIIDMVIDAIVKKAIPKLIAMFIPGAGFISAIISIYDTIMVFVNKLARIVALVKSVVDSIVAIAEGQIDAAAKRVESALASVLSLLISVLAGLFGLGNIAEKVMGVITKIRGTVDKAIDALITWIVKMAKSLFAKVFGKDKAAAPGEAAHAALAQEVGEKLIALPLEEGSAEAPEDRMRKEADKLVAEHQAKLEPGVKMKVLFKPPPADKSDSEIDFEVDIAPNDTKIPFVKPKSKEYLPPETDLYGVLKAKEGKKVYKDKTIQEAHHAPPVELAETLAGALKQGSAYARRSDDDAADALKNAADGFMDAAKSHGADLPAILVHQHTHRTHGVGTTEARIHGSELRPFIDAELTKEQKQDVATTMAGDTVVKPGSAAFKRQLKSVGGKSPLSKALAENGPAIVNRVYDAEEARSIAAVEVALAKSRLDGEEQPRKDAVSKLRTLAHDVWHKLIGAVKF